MQVQAPTSQWVILFINWLVEWFYYWSNRESRDRSFPLQQYWPVWTSACWDGWTEGDVGNSSPAHSSRRAIRTAALDARKMSSVFKSALCASQEDAPQGRCLKLLSYKLRNYGRWGIDSWAPLFWNLWNSDWEKCRNVLTVLNQTDELWIR